MRPSSCHVHGYTRKRSQFSYYDNTSADFALDDRADGEANGLYIRCLLSKDSPPYEKSIDAAPPRSFPRAIKNIFIVASRRCAPSNAKLESRGC